MSIARALPVPAIRAGREGLWRAAHRWAYFIGWGFAWVGAGVQTIYLLYAWHQTDALVYWSAWRGSLYGATGLLVGYIYAPPFAQIIYPLTLLPWTAFAILWTGLAAVAYVWLLAPVRLALRIPLLVCCLPMMVNGNMEWLIALVAVVGLRRPGLWAATFLTKLTPAVGLVWFAARREWRSLAVATGVTAAISAVSFALAPGLWADWIAVMRANVGGMPQGYTADLFPAVPLIPRILASAGLVAWGARTDRRWTLAVAMTIVNPDVWLATFGVLAAVPRLRSRGA